SESTSRSRLSSSSCCQSCTIDQTLNALTRRSSSVGGAASISACFASHHEFAALQEASLVSGTPSLRQLMADHLSLYFFIQRRPLADQVICRVTGMGYPV